MGSDLSARNRDYSGRRRGSGWLGFALTLLVTADNCVGDDLRDVLDPRLRGSQ